MEGFASVSHDVQDARSRNNVLKIWMTEFMALAAVVKSHVTLVSLKMLSKAFSRMVIYIYVGYP